MEGATRAAKSLATSDGHSTDGTREMLAEFGTRHDPGKKLRVITAADEGFVDGFWPEKDEMSQAYAKRISGQWLWQVDSDEFYMNDDMQAVLNILDREDEIATISFPYHEFFGGFHSLITGQWHLYEHRLFHRVFRWDPGYRYLAHRPPTVLDTYGVDLREKHWISSPKNRDRPILLFHYSYVFPKQAQQKVGYYSHVDWTSAFRRNKHWFEESYQRLRRPMFLGEKGWPNLQWLEPYRGEHPEAIIALQRDLAVGKLNEPMRAAGDIERLMKSPLYLVQQIIARRLLVVYWPLRLIWKAIRSAVLHPSG
ncbi:MAG: hypothetical protein WEA61_07135 [Anaerolineales bacterium]